MILCDYLWLKYCFSSFFLFFYKNFFKKLCNKGLTHKINQINCNVNNIEWTVDNWNYWFLWKSNYEQIPFLLFFGIIEMGCTACYRSLVRLYARCACVYRSTLCYIFDERFSSIFPKRNQTFLFIICERLLFLFWLSFAFHSNQMLQFISELVNIVVLISILQWISFISFHCEVKFHFSFLCSFRSWSFVLYLPTLSRTSPNT